MEEKVVSRFLSLGARDFIRGAVIAAISPVFTILIQTLSEAKGEVIINWASIWRVAAVAFLTYVTKNFFEPTKTIVKGEEK